MFISQAWLYRYGWVIAWMLLVITAYLFRDFIPIDETRYLAVAWEMWLRNDFLVPHLNGEPYSHKPPMLFWLFHSGWFLFGVNEWWPKLVSPVFALAGLYLTRMMAQKLWPHRPDVALLAPWVLGGCLYWAFFTSATMFDLPLATMVIVALLGLLRASEGRFISGWLLVGLVAGIGILLKGPVMLLHIVFPALLAPWWNETARCHPLNWYGGLVAALALAVVIALAWALPAASAGGPDFQQAILWSQTAERMVQSFAHQRPIWWYLSILPLMLFPWTVWPLQWRALVGLRVNDDLPVRFLLSWFLPTFIAFSFISGKQPHYLLPLFPAIALLLTYSLQMKDRNKVGRLGLVPIILAIVFTGILLLIVPYMSFKGVPDYAKTISPFWGCAILAVAAVLLIREWKSVKTTTIALSLASIVTLAMASGGFFQAAHPIYDVAPAAKILAKLQAQGAPIANVYKYHGQYHFMGRLKKPIDVILERDVENWGRAHPNGYVVKYIREVPQINAPQPIYIQRYRNKWMSIWAVSSLVSVH